MTVLATSLKLPRALKSRVERLARRTGESPHALMVRVIEEQIDAAERYDAFLRDAAEADKAMQASGTGYRADEVHDYLAAKIGGRPARRPKAMRWRK